MSSIAEAITLAGQSFTGQLLQLPDAAYEERRRVHNPGCMHVTPRRGDAGRRAADGAGWVERPDGRHRGMPLWKGSIGWHHAGDTVSATDVILGTEPPPWQTPSSPTHGRTRRLPRR